MARIKWENVDADVRRMARELVEDPEYRAALHRRLAEGKAPGMMRLLLQWADKKSRDPRELRRGKPTLTVATEYLPGDPAGDPMREKTQRMIEAKAREEEARARQEAAARAQQAARDKPAALPPDDPADVEALEAVDPADYDPPGYRDP